VLPLLATHLSFREMGQRLYVSQHTVKTQALSIYRKLGVSSRSQAVQRVQEIGLLARQGSLLASWCFSSRQGRRLDRQRWLLMTAVSRPRRSIGVSWSPGLWDASRHSRGRSSGSTHPFWVMTSPNLVRRFEPEMAMWPEERGVCGGPP
jgi:Bacterial regulatory proteins, luxR family